MPPKTAYNHALRRWEGKLNFARQSRVFLKTVKKDQEVHARAEKPREPGIKTFVLGPS